MIVLPILDAIAGAVWRHWLGGAKPRVPRGVKLIVGFLLGIIILYPKQVITPFYSIQIVMAAAFLVGMWSLGHGSYQDMGNAETPDNELMKPLLDKLFKERSFLRDFTGMSLIYLCGTVPVGLLLNYWYMPIGILVAVVYAAAWKSGSKRPTEWGEYGAGALIYGALAWV